MKVLITGATGYIGARLSLFLAEKGFEIIAVCSKKIPSKKEWGAKISQFIVGDIRNQNTINEISRVQADVIIHLISLDHHDSEKDPNFVSEVNVQPTWNLLHQSLSQSSLKKFIYFSTIHVYGKYQGGLVCENQEKTPFNAYGLTHGLSEEICNYYHRKSEIDCINIRLSNSYGEPVFYDAMCWDLIVNDLARSVFLDKKIVLKGNGTPIRDFIHYSDICNGVYNLISQNTPMEVNTLHFSSSKSISMLDVALEVQTVYKDVYGEKIPIYINSNEEWLGEKASSKNENSISNQLAKKYNLSFNKELSEGIRELFSYLEIELCPR